MKLISVLQASMAVRVSPEDYMPSSVPPAQDVANALAARYGFLSVNVGNPGTATVMMQGALRVGDEPARAIGHIIFLQDGCVISSDSTNTSKEIFSDLSSFLISNFGYRYQANKCKISYQSAVVVELSVDFSEANSLLYSMSSTVDAFLGGEGQAHLKRLSFGLSSPFQDKPGSIVQPSPLDAVERVDFMIERRVGHPLQDSRFFSTAPLETESHIKALEQIEQLAVSSIRRTRPRPH